ncbi:MAG: sugar kinase [Spirochaetaceae bacterium]|jgi:sugar (pentulose or hexulose) kinase|nr:sugar kinase [Spirochaetaceae bacterium]
MKNKLFFCADLGTSSLKAALIDSSGSLHAFARVSYTASGNGKQSTPASWLSAFFLAAQQLAAPPCPVSALVISGNGPTLVPVSGEESESAETLRPLYWYDPPPRFSGPLSACSSLFLPKVKKFINADPVTFAKTRFLFSPQEWLSWKLGARAVTVIPHKGYVPYYWDEEQCVEFGIDGDRFPPFVTMGEVIGELSPAPLTGPFTDAPLVPKLLAPGTPIIAGAADFIMALIGTGTLEPGTACDRTGSSEGINLCLDGGVPLTRSGGASTGGVSVGGVNAGETSTGSVSTGGVSSGRTGGPLSKELRVLPHAIEGLWNLGAVIPQSGSLFDEYRVSSGQDGKPYGELAAEILDDPAHPGRPVLETMGLNFVKALELIESSGHAVKELVLSGGQCADPRWNQYKANLSGRILKIPEIIHAELAGNAVLAAAALDGSGIREKAAVMIRIKERYLPAGCDVHNSQ